jgi:hypothetical protein
VIPYKLSKIGAFSQELEPVWQGRKAYFLCFSWSFAKQNSPSGGLSGPMMMQKPQFSFTL